MSGPGHLLWSPVLVQADDNPTKNTWGCLHDMCREIHRVRERRQYGGINTYICGFLCRDAALGYRVRSYHVLESFYLGRVELGGLSAHTSQASDCRPIIALTVWCLSLVHLDDGSKANLCWRLTRPQ